MADEQFATAQGTPKAEPDANGDSGANGTFHDAEGGLAESSSGKNGADSVQQANGGASGKDADVPENAPEIKLGADDDEELPCEISHGLSSEGAFPRLPCCLRRVALHSRALCQQGSLQHPSHAALHARSRTARPQRP